MRLYHGSNMVINNINLAMCRPYKDFGQGLYLESPEYVYDLFKDEMNFGHIIQAEI